MRVFPIVRAMGVPVVLDVTHSVQLPGGGSGASGGQAEFIPTLASAGVAAGIDAIFMEVHEDPARAKSDGPNALVVDKLEPLLLHLVELDRVSRAGSAATIPD